ncbi:DUF3363 domain-containing protein [Bradyrhizobium sp. INPA03-11B]|uniref:DUF3363 domain-containing protein n=1 Tax=Bradyrhizobium sp. INPA03-11B TaxID=418598 RepID=UPI0033904014
MGLAEEAGPGHSQLSAEHETKLKRMGERGDIIKTMRRDLAIAGISRGSADTIFDLEQAGQRLVGRVVGEGFRMN